MTTESGTKILILQQRNWGRWIGHPVAKKFHADGFRLGAVTFKRDSERFTRSQTEVPYQFILSHDDVQNPAESSAPPDLPSLDEVCRGLGLDTVWILVQAQRNHVRSYRDKYYYGFKQNVTDDVIVEYVRRSYQACERIFSEFSPDVIIGPNFVGMFHVMLNLLADKHGVRMICVTDSKVRRTSIFSYSYLDARGPFIERVEELNGGAVSANHEQAQAYLDENRDHIVSQGHTPPAVRESKWHSLRMLVRHLRVSLRQSNRLETLPGVLDARSLRIVIRDFLAHRINQRAQETFLYVDLEHIGEFAYMPLQFQPESTIDVLAARFNNQLETARQVAMSLPGDLTLVVKDHPAMYGLRPRSYLEKVARTPNVKLVDFRVPTETVLRRASIVVAPVGTTFMEAALLSVPAIQLGDQGTTLKLPNVVHCSDLSVLSAVIRETLGLDVRSEEYERRLRNFVAAAMDVGFDHHYMERWQTGRMGDMDAIYQEFKREVLRGVGASMDPNRVG